MSLPSRVVLSIGILALVALVPTSSAFLYGAGYYWERNGIVTGYLTWNGSGGISWTSAPATADPGGPAPDALNNPRFTAGGTLQGMTGNDNGLLRTDTFTSQPFPETRFLNVSRSIELVIEVKSQECGSAKPVSSFDTFDVELWIGTTFLAGAVHSQLNYNYYFGGQDFSGGYCHKYFFMHPELDRIEAGAAITLKVLHRGQATGWQYGLGEGHWSQIRFHFFPPEEAAERIPELVAARIQPEEADVEASVESPLILLVGLSALLPAANRRRAPVLLLLLLVGLGLSGCIGGGADDAGLGGPSASGGDIEYHFESPGNGTAGLHAGTGAIVGVVQDAYSFAVSGAHVSLLGTSNFTETNSKGAFEFLSIAPGTYTIHIDRKGFVSLEEEVRVRNGNVTRVTITMVPLVDKGAGFRPHHHNDWGDLASMPLHSGDVTFTTYDYDTGQTTNDLSCSNVDPYAVANDAIYAAEGVAFGTNYNMYARTDCTEPFSLKDKALVLPGTYDIEVKVTWDKNVNKVEKVGLTFGDNRPWNWNETTLYPRKSGEPFHIRSAWEMTDVGHQLFSTWTFGLYISLNDGSPANPAFSHQVLGGPFHVEMTIKKGVVNVEPAHPDRFGEKDTYNTFAGYYAYGYCAGLIGFYVNGYTSPCQDYMTYYYASYPPQPHPPLIPQGTKWAEVWLNETAAATMGPAGWDFKYSPANVPPSERQQPNYQWKTAKAAPGSGKSLHYVIPVTDVEADPFYARSTTWLFQIEERHASPQVYSGQPSWRLTLVSHRDPLPA